MNYNLSNIYKWDLNKKFKTWNEIQSVIHEIIIYINNYSIITYNTPLEFNINTYADNSFTFDLNTIPIMAYDQENNILLIHRENLVSGGLTYNDLIYYIIHEVSHYIDIKLNGKIVKNKSNLNGHGLSFKRILRGIMKNFDPELKEVDYDVTNFGKIPKIKLINPNSLLKVKFLTKEESKKLPKSNPKNTFYSGIDEDGNFVSW